MSDTDTQWRFLDERYELLGQLGGGAVGAVWLVRDRESAAEYAIKILNPGLTADPDAREELRAVLEVVRGLRHPNIVAVDDVVAYEARVALVMRPVAGEDLTALLGRTGALAPAQAALLIAQVCDALAAAHEVNVAHGGVKPANVVLEPEADDPLALRAALTDFGVARLAATAGVTPLQDEIGRPFYAAMPAEYQAPEIGVGCLGSPAADVYAVGVLLYEVLAGHVPFSGDPQEVRQSHAVNPPPRIAGLPDPMWLLIAACLSKEPQHRPSARDLAGLLREIAPTVQLTPQWVVRDAAVAPPYEAMRTGELALGFAARSAALLTAGAGEVDVDATGAVVTRRTAFGTPRRAELAAVVGIIVLAFAATWLFSSIGSGPPVSATFAGVPTQQPSNTLPALAGGAASGTATPSGSVTASATATGSSRATATASGSAAPSASAASRSATPSAVASPSAAAPSPSPAPSQGGSGGGMPGGWVELVNAASGLVLDSGGSVPAGSRLKQWQYGGSPNLHWRLANLGNGYYGLVNEANGMVADSAGATRNGATAVQSPWNGSADQQWSFVDAGHGFYHVVNRGTGTALDGDGQNQIGASTVLWTPNPSPNNEWGISG